MVLLKLEDYDKSFHKDLGDIDIKGYDVYSDVKNDQVGSITDILVDETGKLRYLVADTGFWVTGKRVLLPIGRCRVDNNNRRVYAKGLTKDQVDNLPEFDELHRVNYDYEERVRGVYRTQFVEAPLEAAIPLETEVPLEASAPLDLPVVDDELLSQRGSYVQHKQVIAYEEPVIPQPAIAKPPVPQPVYNRETYTYQHEPDLYETNEQDHQSLKLYEERLVANKQRVKAGEVSIGKHVETETERVAVPVEKERLIIEHVASKDAGKVVSPNSVDFRSGDVVHVDLYEETPDIQKQTVVREEVKVKKVVEQDTVEAQEKVRREELDIDSDRGQIQDRKI